MNKTNWGTNFLIGVRNCIKIVALTQVDRIGLIQSYQAFFCLADKVFFPLCQKSIKIIFLRIGRLNVKNGRKQKNLNYNLTITRNL